MDFPPPRIPWDENEVHHVDMKRWFAENDVHYVANEFVKYEPAGKGTLQTEPITGITHLHQQPYWTEAPDGSPIHHYPCENIWNTFFQMNTCDMVNRSNPIDGLVWPFFWIVLPLFTIFVVLPWLHNKKTKSTAEKIFLTVFCIWYGIFLYANRSAVAAMVLLVCGAGPKLAQENLFRQIHKLFGRE